MSHKFSKNSKYYTIALYSIVVIIASAFIIKVIFNWDSTSTAISNTISILYPFILGLLIAYLINPVTKFIYDKLFGLIFKNKSKAKGAKKVCSIILSYIVVIGLIVTCLFYIIPQITDSLKQITTLVNSAQSGYNQLMEKLLEMEAKHPEWDLTVVNEAIQNIPDKLMDFITNAIPEIIPTIYSTSMSLISGVLNALIAIMVSIYMLIDKNLLLNNSKKMIYALFGAKNGDKILNTAFECNKIFSGFVLGKMIDSLIIGILCFIIMSIIKLPYGLMISVIVGVTNMIPYFGPFIGAVPGVLLLLFVDLKYALIFVVLIIVLQQFDGLFLGPKILGDSTGLRPLWIIFAITVGGSVAGVLGMFLGVPTLAVFAYIISQLLEKRLNKKQIFFYTDPDSGVMSRISNIKPEIRQTEENFATETKQKEDLENIKEKTGEKKNENK